MIDQIVETVQNLFGTRKIRRKPRVIPHKENKIDLRQVSPFAVSVCKRLQEAGYKAYIVGGAVRDLLIGHTPKDFDVATDATPEQVRKVTRRAIIIGRRFRLVHVIKGAETIEVSTFRGLTAEGVQKDKNGRVISDNVFGEQYEDAARRDFTVNALYFDPTSGDVLDYHNGMLDIRKKRIRMIGDPQIRYQEDPVRILRAVRIASKLGFTIDPKTADPMTQMQQYLDNVPAARLNDEMLKMLMSGAALQCVDLMAKYKIEVHLPIFKLLMRERENVFVRKALDRCDARVRQGRSISQSFLYAVLLWRDVESYVEKNSNAKSMTQCWEKAAVEVSHSPVMVGVQGRFINDMQEIWKLQPKFERRGGRLPFRLLNHPRFRAAYDFLLIRASSGEVPHELADWWTAFESASEDDRHIMIQEMERAARVRKTSAKEEGAEDKPKKTRRKRKKKTGSQPANAALQSESVEPQELAAAAEPPQLPAVETIQEPAAKRKSPAAKPKSEAKPQAKVSEAEKSEAFSDEPSAPRTVRRRRAPQRSALLGGRSRE